MPRKIEEPQASAELQEFDVAVGHEAEAGVALVLALQRESLGDVHAWRREPRRIEHHEVVGVDRRRVALAQGVAGEEHRDGATALEPLRASDDRRQRFVLTPVAIDRVQARWAARGLVGLRQDLDGKSLMDWEHGSAWRTFLCSKTVANARARCCDV